MIATRKTFDHIFRNEGDAITYLIENGVFKKPDMCIRCGGSKLSIHRKNWRCTRKQCRKEVSIFENSFFKNMKLKVNEFFELAYYWLAGLKNNQLIIITGHSSQTITNYSHHLRQLVADSLDFTDIIIGGNNIVVEIDESKFGNRKHNRGHNVNGAWVIGGIERTSERRMFLLEVQDRTAETLIQIIKTYVKPGSIIVTDCFKSYANLNNFYTHLTVNHSIEYVNRVTGAHTNTIEGTWGAIKYKISPKNRTSSKNQSDSASSNGINEFLCEFQWRRKNSNDLWKGLMDSFKKVFYENHLF